MRQYETFELTFKGKEAGANEVQADISAVFTINGSKKKVKGFCDGDGIYKVRFLPSETGVCEWKVVSPLELEGELEGREEILPAVEGGHGMVKPQGIHLVHEDGTRYTSFGTTVYALTHQTKEMIEQTFETLKNSPFNKVRMCVFPKHYDFNLNEPEHFAFVMEHGKPNVQKPDYTFWKEFETCLCRLDQLGIEADLILFHPYDHWGFAKLSYEEACIYLDYAVRRLAAFPNVWWSLANEYDLMEHFKREWWDGFAKQVYEQDVFGHMLSNHQCITMWDFNNPYTTHCSIQMGTTQRAAAFQKEFGKPVLFDEVGYEGNLPYSWGNLSGFEMVNRIWTGTVMGAYVTHGEVLYQDQEYNDDAILWWAKGGKLYGESMPRIAFLKGIMEELPGPLTAVTSSWDRDVIKERMKDPEVAETIPTVVKCIANMLDAQFQEFMDGFQEIAGTFEDQIMMQYLGHHCNRWLDVQLPENGIYTVEVIDTWEMTRKVVEDHASGLTKVWLPGKPGIAVLAKKIGKK